MYIDCGLDEASALVHRLFDPVIARSARLGAGLDWKTSLQELTAVKMLGVPDYQVEESGPDHQKSFRAVVRVGGQVLGSGQGRTKKAAEQQAAEAAWRVITAETDAAASSGGRPPQTPPLLGGNRSPQTPSAPPLLGGNRSPQTPSAPPDGQGRIPPLATGNGSRRDVGDSGDGEAPAPEQ